MESSEVYTIIVGEKGEYGNRLVRYLENHLPASARIRRFTGAQHFVCGREEGECYLFDELFYEELSEEQKSILSGKEKVILLSLEEKEGYFCKFHNPAELLERMQLPCVRENAAYGTGSDRERMFSVIYSPIFEENLRDMAREFMEPGDLYLGVEDLGVSGKNCADMGDLCYYIHLREENILKILGEMVSEENGIIFLDSPDMYFYLRELTREDYQWFFDQLKKESVYGDVVLGAGNGFINNPGVFRQFDRVILVDSRDNARQTLFCDHIEHILREDFFEGSLVRFRKEER